VEGRVIQDKISTQGPQDADDAHRRRSSSRYRDALRLMFILVAGSEARENSGSPNDPVSSFRSEKRLMAMDFLVRYPDYLANSLLDLYEETGEQELLEAARSMFAEDEPDARLVKMIRWNYGAYQPVDDSLALLTYFGFVRAMQLRSDDGKTKWNEYLILPKALTFLDDAVASQPALGWYRDRMTLLKRVTADKSGSALKDEQYEIPAYSNTNLGEIIPSIRDAVEARLNSILGITP
jgi:hypothetical protein